jgi:hypothetical protein
MGALFSCWCISRSVVPMTDLQTSQTAINKSITVCNQRSMHTDDGKAVRSDGKIAFGISCG